ncbi:MAG: hypothetical protein AAF488_00850 [Planctomycetota bacterium]
MFSATATPRVRRLLIALCALAASWVAAPAFVFGQEVPDNQGYRSTFRVKLEESRTLKETTSKTTADFKCRLYVFPKDRKERIRVILVLANPEGKTAASLPQDVPIGEAEYDARRDRWNVMLEAPMGRLVSKVVPSLLGTVVPRERLVEYAEGTERVRLRETGMRQPVEVQFRSDTDPVDPSGVIHVRRLENEAKQQVGSQGLTLRQYEETYRFDGDALRVVGLQRSFDFQRVAGPSAIDTRSSLFVEQTERVALGEAERKTVAAQFERFAPLVRAAFPGNFGPPPEGDPIDKLAKLTAAHPDGPFRATYSWLEQNLLARAGGAVNPLAKFDGLEGSALPNFTLTTLDGRKLESESLKGKAVLFFVYSYT